MVGFLYLLRDPALPANVYKIGRTRDLKRRLSEYPRGCHYLRTFGLIVDCHEHERLLIETFKARFERYPKKGLEYFRGSRQDVLRTFEVFCHDDPSPMQC